MGMFLNVCSVSPTMQSCVSGNSFLQQEVGVLFPADDTLHLKRVSGGVVEGGHVTLQLPECPLANELDSHWADAAFYPE